MFKVNNKDTRKTLLKPRSDVFIVNLTYFTYRRSYIRYSTSSVVDFEPVNVS